MKFFKWRKDASAETTSDAPSAERGDIDALLEEDAQQVEGERGIASVNRVSLQSRLSNVLAIGLMALLAIGILAWYYTRTLSQPSAAQRDAQAFIKTKTQGEMPLPPLGEMEASAIARILGPPPSKPSLQTSAASMDESEEVGLPAYGVSNRKTADELVTERRLSGPALLTGVLITPGGRAMGAGSQGEEEGSSGRASEVSSSASSLSGGQGELSSLLRTSVTPAVQAKVLPTERLLLARGAFLDCTLETAIDSTLPGMTTCITATDTFSVDGSVVLLERGTKLVGETRGEVRQGTARVFVLWTEARTPSGVVVPLASPGADELGRSGLPGDVNRHFWERFGAAILISVIDGVVQGSANSRVSGAGTVVINPSASTDILTEVLKSTVNIPPTVTKRQGERISILVARDLDFRTVYELRPSIARP